MLKAKKFTGDVIISIAIFMILAAFASNLAQIPDGAREYPIFFISASALLNSIYFYQSVKKCKENTENQIKLPIEGLFKIILPYLVMTGVYIFLIDKIGYIVSTVLFMILSLVFLKVKNKGVLLLVPILTTAAMYFLFTKFLAVMLPTGIWIS